MRFIKLEKLVQLCLCGIVWDKSLFFVWIIICEFMQKYKSHNTDNEIIQLCHENYYFITSHNKF